MKKLKLNGKRGAGKFALVDDDIYEIAKDYSWCMTDHGYQEAYIDGKTIRLHRLVMGLDNHGRGRQGSVDHKDGNKLDNRKSNLRIATSAQNCANSCKPNIPCSSIYKGVRYRKDTGKWTAQCRGKCFGSFEDEVLAAKVYNTVASYYYGEFARLNDA